LNSSARQIKDEIIENGENLEQSVTLALKVAPRQLEEKYHAGHHQYLWVNSVGLIFVSVRTNKRPHHPPFLLRGWW